MLRKKTYWAASIDAAFNFINHIIERAYPFDLCNGEYDCEIIHHPTLGKLYKITFYEFVKEGEYEV